MKETLIGIVLAIAALSGCRAPGSCPEGTTRQEVSYVLEQVGSSYYGHQYAERIRRDVCACVDQTGTAVETEITDHAGMYFPGSETRLLGPAADEAYHAALSRYLTELSGQQRTPEDPNGR